MMLQILDTDAMTPHPHVSVTIKSARGRKSRK